MSDSQRLTERTAHLSTFKHGQMCNTKRKVIDNQHHHYPDRTVGTETGMGRSGSAALRGDELPTVL